MEMSIIIQYVNGNPETYYEYQRTSLRSLVEEMRQLELDASYSTYPRQYWIEKGYR
jgi:hypothetical protein